MRSLRLEPLLDRAQWAVEHREVMRLVVQGFAGLPCGPEQPPAVVHEPPLDPCFPDPMLLLVSAER